MARFVNHSGVAGLRSHSRAQTKMLFLTAAAFLVLLAIAGILLTQKNASTNTSTVASVQKNGSDYGVINVLVPVGDLPAGIKLTPSMFRFESRPASSKLNGAISDISQVNGMFANQLIPSGTTLSKDYLTDTKPSIGVRTDILPGYRAVTINVNVTSAVEGWVRAGARVDVAWTTRINGQPGITVIIQNATVLSAERQTVENTQNPAGSMVPSTITLLVSEADSKKLILATTAGSLSLALRGDNDNKIANTLRPITTADLLGRVGDTKNRRSLASLTVKEEDGNSKKISMIDGEFIQH